MLVSPVAVPFESIRIWTESMTDARLHPDLVKLDPAASVYIDGGSVAVLRRMPRREALVAGNRLLGDDGDDACARFTAGLVDLLAMGETDVIRFDDLPCGNLFQLLKHVGGATFIHDRASTPHMFFDLPLTESGFWSSFSQGTRRTFRKRIREIGGGVVRYDCWGDLPALVAAMDAVYPLTWQSHHVSSHFLSTPDIWEFLARRDAMRCFVLHIGEEPVAYHVGCLWGGHFLCVELGYDTRYSHLKAGTTLTCLVILSLIEKGEAHMFDWGWGGDEYKRMFSNRQTQNVRAKLVARRFRPHMSARASQAAVEARLFVSRGLKTLGVFDRVRRFVRSVESAMGRDPAHAKKV